MRRLARCWLFIAVTFVCAVASASPAAANNAPVVLPLDDIYGLDDTTPIVLDLNLGFSDPDGDPLTYSLFSNTNASFVTATVDEATDTLTITRTSVTEGSAVVTVRANDGTASVQSSIRVTDADHVWTGAGSDNRWSTGANWAPVGVPWSEDVALIDSGNKPVELTVANVTVGGLRVEPGYTGTIDLGGRNLNVFGNLDLGGASVIATGSTISLSGATPMSVTGPSTPIGNLTIAAAGEVQFENDLTIAGTLRLTTVSSLQGSALRALGNVQANDTSYGGSTELAIAGSGPQTISKTGGIGLLHNLRIDKPSGSATFVGNYRSTGYFVHEAGATTLTNTRITFYDELSEISASTLTFDDLELAQNFEGPLTGDLDISGNLLISGVAGLGLTGGGLLNVEGNVTSTDSLVNSTVGIRFVGSADQTITAQGADLTNGDLIIDKPNGAVVMATAVEVTDSSQRLRLAAGVLDANGHALSVGNGVVVEGGTLVGATTIGRQQAGDALTVSSGVLRLEPGSVASVLVGGGLAISGGTLEIDLTDAPSGNQPHLLTSTTGRLGEFDEIVVLNNAAGFTVTPTYNAQGVGANLVPPNDPPAVAGSIPNQFGFDSASSLSLAGLFTDADGDPLTYSVSLNSDAGFVAATISGAQLSLSPSPGQVGNSVIAIRATDPAGDWAETTFRVTDADSIWTGQASTDWHDAENWLPPAVPGETDLALLDSGTDAIEISNDHTVRALRISDQFSGLVTVQSDVRFTVAESLTQLGGSLDLTGATLILGGDSELLAEAVTATDSTLTLRTGASVDAAGNEWHDVRLQSFAANQPISLDADLVVGGSLTVDGPVTVAAAQPTTTMRLRGDVHGGTATVSGATPIVFEGTGDQAISGIAGLLGPDGRAVTIDKAAGTLSLANPLNVSDLALVAGSLDLGGHTLTTSGNLDLSGGTVNADESTIMLGDGGSAPPISFRAPDGPINDLTIDSGATVEVLSSVDVDGLFTLASVVRLNGSTIRASGDVRTADTGYEGSAVLALVGEGDQAVIADSATSSLRNVRIDKPFGTVAFDEAFQAQGSFVHVGGVVGFGDPSATDHTVTFVGANLDINAPGLTFDGVTLGGDAGGQITGALRVGGLLTIDSMAGPTTAGSGGEIVALGDVLSNDDAVDSAVPIRLSGGLDQNVSGADLTDADIIVDKPAGRAVLGDALDLNGVEQDVVVMSGMLDTQGNSISVPGGVVVDGGVLTGGGAISSPVGGLTVTSGAVAIDPDDPAMAFQVDGPMTLGGSLLLDLTEVAAGSYLDLLTSVGPRNGVFAALEAAGTDNVLVINERYDANRAGVVLGDPLDGQVDDLAIELPAAARSIDLAAEFGRSDLTFTARSSESFVTATIDAATPGILDLTFAPAATGAATVTIDVSSVDSGTETITFTVTLIDSTNPVITVAEPLDGAAFAHDASIPVEFECADLGGTGVVSCAGSIGEVPVGSGQAAPPLAPGSHALVVTATDAAGNSATLTRPFWVLAPLTADLVDLALELPAVTTTIDLDAAFGETGLWYQVSSDQPFVTRTIVDGVLELDYEAAVTGSAVITVNALSPSGANGAAVFAVSLIDSAAPAITMSDPGVDEAFAHDEAVPIGYACDATGGTAIVDCSAQVEGETLDGNTIEAFSVVAATSIDSLEPGNYSLVVTATDAAGNTQAGTSDFTVLDELVGEIASVSRLLPVQSLSIDLGSAFGRSSLQYEATSNQAYVVPTVGSENPELLTLSFSSGRVGTAEVTVRATSTDGARGTATFTVSLVDAAAPGIVIESPAARGEYAFGEPIRFRFRCDDLGGTQTVNCGGEVDGAVVTADAAVANLPSGTHRFVVQARDAAGNSATVTRTFTVTAPLRVSPVIGTEFERTSGADGALTRLYVAVFNRAPDAAGFAYWRTRLDEGMSMTELTVLLVRSPEYRAIYNTPNDADFVDYVYRNVLRRSADPAGKRYWLGEISDDFDRARLLMAIAESEESKAFSNTR